MDKWTYVAYVQYPCDQVIKNKIVIKESWKQILLPTDKYDLIRVRPVLH